MAIWSDNKNSSRNLFTLSVPSVAAFLCYLLIADIFGFYGNSSFRTGPVEEIKLLVDGKKYEAAVYCGDASKKLGKPLLTGILGTNNPHFRAWNDNQAQQKAKTGLKTGCWITNIYQLKRAWYQRYPTRYQL